jgi:hypothetical protein
MSAAFAADDPNRVPLGKPEKVVRDNQQPYCPDPPQATRTGTPQSTVEALMWGLRKDGLACLSEPKNCERLSRCDSDAMKQISARLLDLKSRSKGDLDGWTNEDVAKLLSTWRTARRRA